jgi:hypothetical protein
MAVFLLKTLEGSTYAPPACAGDFDDVQCLSRFADWIDDLAARGITGGCQANPSPDQSDPSTADGGLPREDVRSAALLSGSGRR